MGIFQSHGSVATLNAVPGLETLDPEPKVTKQVQKVDLEAGSPPLGRPATRIQ